MVDRTTRASSRLRAGDVDNSFCTLVCTSPPKFARIAMSPSSGAEPAKNRSMQLQPDRMIPMQRGLSLAELIVGGAIVIGHNVYHFIPNEVPILFVLGLASLRLRGGSWAAIGLK